MEKEIALSEVLKNTAETSTLHGIPRIVPGRHWTIRLLWLLAFLCTTGCMLYQLVGLFEEYFSYKVNVKTALKFSALRFPAISFCNMNPIKLSKLDDASRRVREVIQASFIPGSNKTDPSSSLSIQPTPASLFEDSSLSAPESLLNGLSSILSVDSSDLYELDSSSEIWTSYLSQFSQYEDIDGEVDGDRNWQHYFYQDLKAEKDKWLEKVERFRAIFKNETLEKRWFLGHSVEDLVHKVTFATQVQDPKDFKNFTTPEYGNCFTLPSTKHISWKSGPKQDDCSNIDHTMKATSVTKLLFSGGHHEISLWKGTHILKHAPKGQYYTHTICGSIAGIHLILNLEEDEYIQDLSSGYGVRMVIHESETYPFPTEEGFTLDPGREINIGLRRVSINRLSDPYGRCTDGQEFRNLYGVQYSVTLCFRLCQSKRTLDVCGCLLPESPDFQPDIPVGMPICNELNLTNKLCMLSVAAKFDDATFTCDCDNPCSDEAFDFTISGRSWPNENYLVNVLMKELCEKERKKNSTYISDHCLQLNDGTLSNIIQKLQNNFLSVNIYYEDLNYEVITEEPQYEIERFLADIGGASGLFVGASVLSVMELIELIVVIFLHVWKKGRGYNSNIVDVKPFKK